jgi:hypothetical protein
MVVRLGPSIFAAALSLASCTGTVMDPAHPPEPEPPIDEPPTGPAATPDMCRDGKVRPGRAPLRRLTRFEYNNTVRDLLGDVSSPANALPAEELGNGFGNDAAAQAVSTLLAEEYATVAEGIAARATQTPAALGKLHACGATVTAGTEESCARSIIEGLAPRAFRRPLASGEADDLLALYRATRGLAGATFATAVAAMIEAVLQAPDFLYRVELGTPDRERPELRRPTGDEMASRLSYFLWGTMPDPTLRMAARSGELLTADGVLAQATRMLADPKARPMVRYFFDNLLPISGLTDLERDPKLYPEYTAVLGALMQQETQRLLEYEVFEANGSWASALTAPYTFLNGPLATFYKVPGVQGMAFQKVPVDPQKRLGIITHASIMSGTTHSNHTNPVVRGAFIAGKLLCLKIPLPDASIAEKIKPPDPYSGKTARDRYTQHQQDPVCRGCHASMDPLGFTLENFDAIGRYRAEENGVTIDASGSVPGSDGMVSGAAEMMRKVAELESAQSCFAGQFIQFAFGKSLGPEDACLQSAVDTAFTKAGGNIKQLLLALTQTDAFVYLPGSP